MKIIIIMKIILKITKIIMMTRTTMTPNPIIMMKMLLSVQRFLSFFNNYDIHKYYL